MLLLRSHGDQNAAQILKEVAEKDCALCQRDPFDLLLHFTIKLMERSFEFLHVLGESSNGFDFFKIKIEIPQTCRLKDKEPPDGRVIPGREELHSDCMNTGENAVIQDAEADAFDVLPRQSRQDFISLARLCACKKFDKGLQFVQEQVFSEKQVRNHEGMEKINETSEEGVFPLIKASFQEKGVFCNPQEKEIAVLHRLQKLTVELFGILFEEIMAA